MNFVEKEGILYEYALWDGLILTVEHDNHETKLSRNDLLEYIPDLDIEFIKKQKK